MMSTRLVMQNLLAGLTVSSLLLAMGLHALQIAHEHFGVMHGYDGYSVPYTNSDGTGSHSMTDLSLLDEKMHISDKKLLLLDFVLVLYALALLAPTWAQRLLQISRQWFVKFRLLKTLPIATHSFLRLFLAQGLINPRLYRY